jgi:glycosyltransferase involved in cell wall biosynthesis
MKIAINGRFLTQKTTGVQRYAKEVVRALDLLLAEEHPAASSLNFELVAPTGELSDFPLESIPLRQVGLLHGHLWEQFDLPRQARSSHLLSLGNTGPISKPDQTVVIHDAAVFAMPHTFSRGFRHWYQFLLPLLGRRAKSIVTVSNFSEAELIKYCNIPAEKISVVTEGFEHMLRQESDEGILSRHRLNERPFVFAVSSLNPSKNFSALVQAIDHLDNPDFNVVIAGGTNPAVFDSATKRDSAHVRYLGYVSDSELKALYQHASCFVHPSLYEGFGLTPLEAMACGAPVIASDIPALKEVCGDAALYADPRVPSDIGAKINRVMSSPQLREELVARGNRRLLEFSWRSCALELIRVIQGGAE